MSAAWKLSSQGAEWTSGGLAGQVVVRSTPLGQRLALECPELGVDILLDHVEDDPEVGQTGRSPLVPGTMMIQEPYLVVPHAIESEVGLRVVTQFLAEPGRNTLDLRLETIAPLRSVSVHAHVSLTLARWSSSTDFAINASPSQAPVWLEIVKAGEVRGALQMDLGEAGTARILDSDRADVTLFDQPLEKGVILVGRFALVERKQEESLDAFRRRAAEGLAEATYL
jgi:hypothetical protein